MHAEVCRAISCPEGLQMLRLLRDAEHSVSEIAEAMGVPSANVSQQLSALRKAGAIGRRP
jgi:DNA-binding transcriptional ArsR family regulator